MSFYFRKFSFFVCLVICIKERFLTRNFNGFGRPWKHTLKEIATSFLFFPGFRHNLPCVIDRPKLGSGSICSTSRFNCEQNQPICFYIKRSPMLAFWYQILGRLVRRRHISSFTYRGIIGHRNMQSMLYFCL